MSKIANISSYEKEIIPRFEVENQNPQINRIIIEQPKIISKILESIPETKNISIELNPIQPIVSEKQIVENIPPEPPTVLQTIESRIESMNPEPPIVQPTVQPTIESRIEIINPEPTRIEYINQEPPTIQQSIEPRIETITPELPTIQPIIETRIEIINPEPIRIESINPEPPSHQPTIDPFDILSSQLKSMKITTEEDIPEETTISEPMKVIIPTNPINIPIPEETTISIPMKIIEQYNPTQNVNPTPEVVMVDKSIRSDDEAQRTFKIKEISENPVPSYLQRIREIKKKHENEKFRSEIDKNIESTKKKEEIVEDVIKRPFKDTSEIGSRRGRSNRAIADMRNRSRSRKKKQIITYDSEIKLLKTDIENIEHNRNKLQEMKSLFQYCQPKSITTQPDWS